MVGDIFFTKTLIQLIKCAKNSKWNKIKTWFFKRFLFGCSTANFGPLLAGHAHSPYVYHYINQNDSVVEEVEVFVNPYYGEGESNKNDTIWNKFGGLTSLKPRLHYNAWLSTTLITNC